MLTGGTDPAYRALLRTGGQFVRRLEVWRSGVRIDPYGDAGAPLTKAALSASLESRVTRRLRLAVPASLFPASSGDLFDPLQSELVLWAGWRGGAAPPYWWPVFTGPVVSAALQVGSATAEVSATDRAEQIIEDRFTAPVRSGAGVLVTTRVRDLISDSAPDAVFGQFDETYAVVPELTWEAERAKALDDLAAGAGCYWYALPNGEFTLRRIPWGGDTLPASVATITAGDDATSVKLSTSRSGVYTICQASGEAANGQAPVSGTVYDSSPTSRTYYLGPLGRRVLKVQEDTIASTAQAESVARQRLRRARVSLMGITTSTLFDPAMELGDTATVVTPVGTFVRSLSSFSTDLTGAPNMSSQWRAPGGDDD
jgi:hypothetical protein